MNLTKLPEMVKDREAWRAAVHGVAKSRIWLTEQQHTALCQKWTAVPCVSGFLTQDPMVPEVLCPHTSHQPQHVLHTHTHTHKDKKQGEPMTMTAKRKGKRSWCLHSLFKLPVPFWWTNSHRHARPLSSWLRVTGWVNSPRCPVKSAEKLQSGLPLTVCAC